MSTRARNARDVTKTKWENPLLANGRVEVELPRLFIQVERECGRSTNRTYVHDGEICRVGSAASNDLVLEDPTISRFHCSIQREGGAWRIVDTGSTNGTRVDGVRILSAELEGQAVLAVGDSRLRVRADRGESASLPVVSAFGSLLGTSAAMQRLFATLERVAASDIDALIHGESGTGKELVATEIVQRSARAQGPLIVVDCGSISPALVESELFGHVRGAFTGADRDREGAFEAADGGTVFLDEIGELPIELQPKLLRALEQREVRRVGTSRARRVDVRVIAATHRELEREVNRGRFRDDLFYRLAKVSVRVPPLRDRLEDLPLLIDTFLAAFGRRDGGRLFSPEVVEQMMQHDWPGNVRELRNYVERSIVLDDAPPPSMRTMRSGTMPVFRLAGDEKPSEPTSSPPAASSPPPEIDRSIPFRLAKERAVEKFERAYIGPLLEECEGNMSKAARTARMDRMYLHQLAQKYGFRITRRPAAEEKEEKEPQA
ncbi:MAG TPA: sigma 54-interacting transcriptional regulator [Labilithrix sp.]|nr:sigma 54-interacting transcriptional regulator [Labilithrix sp.]